MKNSDEIKAEVEKLKNLKGKIPAQTAFGDDNIASIDAQIEVLEKGLDEDDVYRKNDDGDWTDHTKDGAMEAVNWREEEMSASDSWAPLVK